MYDENICSLFCTRLKIIVYFAVCFELVVTDDVCWTSSLELWLWPTCRKIKITFKLLSNSVNVTNWYDISSYSYSHLTKGKKCHQKSDIQFYNSLTKIIKVNHSVHLHCIFFNKNWIKLKLSSQLSASHIHFKHFTLYPVVCFNCLRLQLFFHFFSWQPCIYLNLYP